MTVGRGQSGARALAADRFPRRGGRFDSKVAYDAFRSQIRTGDLLFCSGVHPFSELIKMATNSVWSHVAFVVRFDQIDRVMVFESVEPSGVRAIPLSKYINDYENGEGYPGGLVLARHRRFPDNGQAEKLLSFGQYSIDQFGYRYDRDQILKLAGRVVATRMGMIDKTSFDDDKALICSEYVEKCMLRVDIPVKAGKHGFVAPSDFVIDRNVEHLVTLKNPIPR